MIFKVDDTSYQFKHALIQESAYQSQAKADRQAVHQRIESVLQHNFSEMATIRPELLAQHLTAAGEIRTAVGYWIRADHGLT